MAYPGQDGIFLGPQPVGGLEHLLHRHTHRLRFTRCRIGKLLVFLICITVVANFPHDKNYTLSLFKFEVTGSGRAQ